MGTAVPTVSVSQQEGRGGGEERGGGVDIETSLEKCGRKQERVEVCILL